LYSVSLRGIVYIDLPAQTPITQRVITLIIPSGLRHQVKAVHFAHEERKAFQPPVTGSVDGPISESLQTPDVLAITEAERTEGVKSGIFKLIVP
jgi:hypothetical protein